MSFLLANLKVKNMHRNEVLKEENPEAFAGVLRAERGGCSEK